MASQRAESARMQGFYKKNFLFISLEMMQHNYAIYQEKKVGRDDAIELLFELMANVDYRTDTFGVVHFK